MINQVFNWLKGLFVKSEVKVFSLNEYLDILSHYTDNVIETENNNENYYTGGDCSIEYMDDLRIGVYIRMYFIDANEQRTMKESKKILKMCNFDKKTCRLLQEGSKTFEIIKPKMEV